VLQKQNTEVSGDTSRMLCSTDIMLLWFDACDYDKEIHCI